MKMALVVLVAFSTVQSNDLVYKHSFENKFSISGNVKGLKSTGLILRMHSGIKDTVNEIIEIHQNGHFAFFQMITKGDEYSISIVALPNKPFFQSCELTNSNGIIILRCSNEYWSWHEMNWNYGGWQ